MNYREMKLFFSFIVNTEERKNNKWVLEDNNLVEERF